MKIFLSLAFLICTECLALEEMVAVPDAGSPDGKFFVRLTYDRVKETDPIDISAPDVQIVAADSGRILVSFPFAADPVSDAQPLRKKVRANWNLDGTAVALSFSERFYTHMLVYRLKGTFAEPESFVPVTLPETAPIIKAMIPRFKEFRSRWDLNFQGWPGRNVIQYSAGTGAIINPASDGNPIFMGVYSFSVDISDLEKPIISRVEKVREEDY